MDRQFTMHKINNLKIHAKKKEKKDYIHKLCFLFVGDIFYLIPFDGYTTYFMKAHSKHEIGQCNPD